MVANDVDVDYDELNKYIDTLYDFWRTTQDDWRSVEAKWAQTAETWRSDERTSFEREYMKTDQALKEAFGSLDDALHWLGRYREILDEL